MATCASRSAASIRTAGSCARLPRASRRGRPRTWSLPISTATATQTWWWRASSPTCWSSPIQALPRAPRPASPAPPPLLGPGRTSASRRRRPRRRWPAGSGGRQQRGAEPGARRSRARADLLVLDRGRSAGRCFLDRARADPRRLADQRRHGRPRSRRRSRPLRRIARGAPCHVVREHRHFAHLFRPARDRDREQHDVARPPAAESARFRARRGERLQRRLRGLEHRRTHRPCVAQRATSWSGSNTHRPRASRGRSIPSVACRPTIWWVSWPRTSTATATGMCSLAPTARARVNTTATSVRTIRSAACPGSRIQARRSIPDSPRCLPPQAGHVRRVRHQGHGRRRGSRSDHDARATARRLTACCGSSRCAQNTQYRASRGALDRANRTRVPRNDAADRCRSRGVSQACSKRSHSVVAAPGSSRPRLAA